uniref:Uncharacterized protein n=1 Tax=Chromera velia CCMP2878 TaxID=1169474 RepID=A0A0G4FN21_9ALVE|eukprot:Cvel_3547.t1-p1 / transcript=Cvel_3547.t1 / gene=Cvel_3547 / organism=Chromera_velia_CCMP2878 / gene_product=Myosin-10, putative / transcript_product=Myosin-10, putative / location=Cvel_scaffold144:107036-115710(+) / protein_length=854 / sequence_SO=supercontig / SO=protein_coding / is_pseudo=false
MKTAEIGRALCTGNLLPVRRATLGYAAARLARDFSQCPAGWRPVQVITRGSIGASGGDDHREHFQSAFLARESPFERGYQIKAVQAVGSPRGGGSMHATANLTLMKTSSASGASATATATTGGHPGELSAQIRGMLDSLERISRLSTGQVPATVERLSQTETALRSALKEKGDLVERLHHLEKSRRELHHQVEDLKVKQAQALSRLQEERERLVKAQKDTVTRLQSEFNKERKNLAENLQGVEEAYASQAKTGQRLQSEVTGLKTALQKEGEEKRKYEDKVKDLQKLLNETVMAGQKTAVEWKAKCDEIETAKRGVERVLQEAQKELIHVKTDNAAAAQQSKQAVRFLNDERKQLENRVQFLEEDLATEKEAREKLVDKCETLNKSLQSRAPVSVEDHAKMAEELDRLKTERDSLRGDIGLYRKETGDYKVRIAELTGTSSRLQRDCDLLQKSMSSFREVATKSKEKVAALESECEQLRKEKEQAEEALKEVESEKTRLLELNNGLRKDLCGFRDRLDNLERQIKSSLTPPSPDAAAPSSSSSTSSSSSKEAPSSLPLSAAQTQKITDVIKNRGHKVLSSDAPSSSSSSDSDRASHQASWQHNWRVLAGDKKAKFHPEQQQQQQQQQQQAAAKTREPSPSAKTPVKPSETFLRRLSLYGDLRRPESLSNEDAWAMMVDAGENGSVEELQWLSETSGFSRFRGFSRFPRGVEGSSSSSGVEEEKEKDGEKRALNALLIGAAQGNRVDNLRWALERGARVSSLGLMLMILASMRGHFGVIHFCHKTAGINWYPQCAEYAAKRGHLELLKTLRANGYELRLDSLRQAALQEAEKKERASEKSAQESVVQWVDSLQQN